MFIDVPVRVARSAARQGRARVPVAGVLAARKRLVSPSVAAGFDRVETIRE